MKRIAEHVLNVCHDAEIHIPAISFDGKWHLLAVRDANNKPLTKLQLQKDIWKEIEGKKKQEVLAELKVLNKQPDWEILKNGHGDIIRIDAFRKVKIPLPKISERVIRQRIMENEHIKQKSKRVAKKRRTENR
ncbi:hypothetical protein DPMN_050706 [Dreissena polymorpha]|uniref:Uncharacterized protein n=1 Tax=Dreissena polymorpha TaxID=45954 RepID=A0A9D4CGM8_DREPO|nr:hypothetical protein DPMN_050706 [Dreissena polymorpha]